MAPSPIDVSDLVVSYGRGAKRTAAVRGVSFRVDEGECVGFIGANGAGKSTTIKALMGFVFPESGSVKVYGRTPGDAESRRRIGYLPEVALYYPFMKARELLELYGGLSGMGAAEVRAKAPALLEQVGLAGCGERLLRTFSKGMQQRLGIAQALLADPDLLILDELSSGLDPLGRAGLRTVLQAARKAGKTIFFSSHELTEVEALCDRVVMIHQGRIVRDAPVSDLIRPLNRYEVTFAGLAGEPAGWPDPVRTRDPRRDGADQWTLETDSIEAYTEVLEAIRSADGEVRRAVSKSISLEDDFIRLVQGGTEAAAG